MQDSNPDPDVPADNLGPAGRVAGPPRCRAHASEIGPTGLAQFWIEHGKDDIQNTCEFPAHSSH